MFPWGGRNMNFMDYLEEDTQKNLNILFQTCPQYVLKVVEIKKVKKGQSFIHAGEKCRNIFILLQGKAKGLEMHLEEKMYIFQNFTPGRIFGELEFYTNQSEYMATIQAVENCVLAIVPQNIWENWMETDVQALKIRTRQLVSELTNQLKEERNHLFLNCYDRMILFLIEQYEKDEALEKCSIGQSRTILADLLGFSVKTINRTVVRLCENNMVQICNGKMHFTKEQYLNMQNYSREHFFL